MSESMSGPTSGTWDLAGGEFIAPGLRAVEAIGGGTEYEAWLAFDERLHAPVVVKVLRPHRIGDAQARDRMRREIAMLERLVHPGIVRMYSHDVDAERPWIVLEHIDGPTLSSLISSDGYLPVHQLVPVGLELLSALHYLRHEGVVHLDLKPSNVVTGSPAKLIDLSLAMDQAEAAALDYATGSAEYMAPEQCRPGERGVVGHAADMWGFGATMFRAAAGYRAWAREPRWAQLTEPPRALPDHVPAPIAEVILACLTSGPQDRPAPLQVAEVFEDVMAALPTPRLAGFSLKR